MPRSEDTITEHEPRRKTIETERIDGTLRQTQGWLLETMGTLDAGIPSVTAIPPRTETE